MIRVSQPAKVTFEPPTFNYGEPTMLLCFFLSTHPLLGGSLEILVFNQFPYNPQETTPKLAHTAVSQSFHICGFLQIVEDGIDNQIFLKTRENILCSLLCSFKDVFSNFFFHVRFKSPFSLPTK